MSVLTAALALSSVSLAVLPALAASPVPALASVNAAVQPAAVLPATVARHYAVLAHANYSDTLAAVKDMQAAIAALVKAPSAAGLEEARNAWLAAREFYGQTEAFRFYGGPIDDDNGPEGQINAWPLDEAYVDYVQGKPKAGMVNSTQLKITKAALIKANERGGEENISTGWHAIEFLLWGQDLSETGAGQRSFEDYVVGKGLNAERRARYLSVATELLVDDLTGLVKAWAPNNTKNYRAQFEKGGVESVRKMVVGLGSLSRGELSGERMEVALNSQDQEDEHSCFSDNTHRDIVTNALGIQNVWLVAAWEADSQHHVGLISVRRDSWSLQQSVALPTRPHALLAEPGGTVLVVARRPGDWLLRWRPGTTPPQQQWHWINGERRFNGHAIASARHAQIWTPETD